MNNKPNRGRRTPEERAFDDLYKQACRDNRDRDHEIAEQRRAAAEHRLDSKRAAQTQREQLRREADDALARQQSEDLQDYHFGRTTPGARRVRETLEKVAAANRRVEIAGDPLNLTGHTRPPRLSRDMRRKKSKERAQRFVDFHTPGGRHVKVDLKSNPLIGIYRAGGIDAPQFAAASTFQNDVNSASYAGMQCRGFEPSVDGGKMASLNLAAIDAQNRLYRLRGHLQTELYGLLEAVVAQRISLSDIYRAGGPHKRTLGDKLREALNKASVFYGYKGGDEDSTTTIAIRKVRERREATKSKPDRDHPYR